MERVRTDKNIPCKLSDGAVLRSDVYRPDDNEEYPILMLRLPYDKETPRYYDEYLDVPRLVEAGYAVILQDVRGRFASDGEFYPFIHEGEDGYEAVEWAAGLSFSNGKVGLFGMSYHGYTQLAAAAEKPPSLKAIAPVMTMGNPWGDILGDEGSPNATGKFETWVLGSIVEDQLKRRNRLDRVKLNSYLEDMAEWLHYAPADEWMPMKELDPNSFFFDVMQDKVDPEWKENAKVNGKLKSGEIPALFMGGWFDALLGSTLEAYEAYGGPRMLWIGPWTHEEMTGQAGDKFFNNAAENIGVDKMKDPTEVHIKWFDRWLKDKPMPIEKPVHIYLMGKAEWAAYDEWPCADNVKDSDVYLHSEGFSQTRSGDGGLMLQSQKEQTSSALKLDPEHPVPVFGGGTLIAGHESGMFDVKDIQDREDVLVYTSEPLAKDHQLLGPVKAVIWGSSPSELFDVSLRLSDVNASGCTYNIIDTFHREKVASINKPFCLELDIGSTAYLLEKGHYLRLDIAASKAPHFDVNLNNGKTTKTHADGKAAFEHIYHGGLTASRLILRLVEEKS
ncbi:acyl esterase [Lentibacillus kapialis]|uniref:Acyl esterase n=1 Tax=Lentibacillus kapialis TaxID=340214 RepID=A0A917PXE7_9BACI|nr:CocE/NonD family hydrolase [Lentibacillus kapialis]GGJ97416.1 acyl esterase [Lentibacillus kapialis]